MTDSDYILIAKLNASSKQAFGEIYDKYVTMVYSFALSVIHDESVAEDITQLVFVRLWEPANPYPQKRICLPGYT